MVADDRTEYFSLKYLAGRRLNTELVKELKYRTTFAYLLLPASVACHGEFYTGECKTRTGTVCGNLSWL